MREYNEYLVLTKERLKNYRHFKTYIENTKAEINELEKTLNSFSDINAPIAKYNGMPGGGSGELNTVEMAAEKRLEYEKEIRIKRENLSRVEMLIANIDNSINTLSDDYKAILTDFYCNGYRWEQVAEKHHYSESWTRKTGYKLLKIIALDLFGDMIRKGQIVLAFNALRCG